MKTLQHEGGMWSETDIPIRRQGEDGRLVAEAMLDGAVVCFRICFAGRSGRPSSGSRTVKGGEP
ncbi:MAG: hypothetical protein CM15mP79_1710 [Methanobacteriota archaeon]|nr:MAG: hypothetical protein CM15mP79_1710 [Euryarchaeota archaeon]